MLNTQQNMDEEGMKNRVQLLSFVSHELRNPLACIMGLLELLLDEERDGEGLKGLSSKPPSTDRHSFLSDIFSECGLMRQILVRRYMRVVDFEAAAAARFDSS